MLYVLQVLQENEYNTFEYRVSEAMYGRGVNREVVSLKDCMAT